MLSRVAESLYWMSRYVERAEHTARLIAVKLDSMVEQSPDEAAASWGRVVQALTGEKLEAHQVDAFAITRRLAFDTENDASLINSLSMARYNARQVREALSNEVWENLNRLYLRLSPVTMDSIWVHTPARLFREALEDMHALEGVTYSTLSHGEGWYFLELGRHIERVQLVGRLLNLHFNAAATEGAVSPKYFDWLVLLKFCTAFEPYTKRYTASIRPQKIAEFLLFDAEFPHSICFSIDRMTEALAHVAPGAAPARRAAVERLAGRLKSAVDFGQIDDLMNGGIDSFIADVIKQCEQIHHQLYQSYITYGAETVL
ncbi:MAG: alpha-E domain-containing protein [Alphaproteobacteria bacterium]|nr:alpha-E domain-containing protein [Alphaproteobacteria bacterium]